MFAPAKQRSSQNWPLRTCCGCIPNPAGMITLGCITLIFTLWGLSGMADQNRAANQENACKDSSVLDATGPMRLTYFITALVSIVAGILFLYLGIAGCLMQGQSTGGIQQGGCCGKKTGVLVGKGAIGCALLMYFLSVIMNLILAAGAKGIAKASCCQILAYNLDEGHIEEDLTDDGGFGWDANADGKAALDLCGFKNGKGFQGIDRTADNPFKTAGAEQKVEESNMGMMTMMYGVVMLIVSLLCCGCCTSFVYSATYEISEAGDGVNGTTVGAV